MRPVPPQEEEQSSSSSCSSDSGGGCGGGMGPQYQNNVAIMRSYGGAMGPSGSIPILNGEEQAN